MDDQVLQGVSTSPPTEDRRSFWQRCFCFKSGSSKVLSEDERHDIARERWRKVAKLRFMLVSLKFAKEQTNEIEQGQYLGQVKEEETEDSGPPEKGCMVYPWYHWKTYFDMLCAMLILYFCFATPFRIGFNSDYENSNPIDYELVFDGVLFIDIILTFFTAYIADIEVIDDRWMIASRYIRGLFFFDLISCIPFYLINANLMWLKIFRLLHVGRITTLLENSTALVSKMTSDKMILDWHTKIHISRIMRFLLYLATTCHCIACFWHYIAIKEDVPLEKTWMQGVVMTNQEAYVASLYWTMVTFSTVGYGDITPKTDAEIAYTMVVEFIGILFFAYLMGNVSSIISNINMRAQALSKRETDLDKWLLMLDKNRSDKRLKPELHSAIRNYFTYIWKNDHSYLINDSEFMMRLPYKLRNELTQHLFSDEVEKFEVFFKNCNEQFKFQVVLNMFPRKFKKFEEIIPEGVPVQEVYFIDSGSVLLGTKQGKLIFLKLPTRSYFGDNYLIFNTKPSICYM